MADLSWAPVLCVFERVGVPEAVASGEGLATFWRPRRWCRASGEAGLDTTFEGATPGTSAERARLPGAATLPVRRARSPFDFAHALGAGFFSEAARSMGLAATGAASSHLQGAVTQALWVAAASGNLVGDRSLTGRGAEAYVEGARSGASSPRGVRTTVTK